MAYRKKHIGPKIRNLRKQKKLWKRPVFWIFLLLVFIVGTGLYLFYFFPPIQIKGITITGNKNISAADIENLAWQNASKKILGLSSKSIFIENSKALAGVILGQFPEISKVTVRKIYPSTLSVSVTERQPVAAFCQETTCFSIDASGVIFQQASGTPNGMVITSDTKENMSAGSQVVPATVMHMIEAVQKNLKENFNIVVANTSVSDTVIFTTQEGWKAYFDPQGDNNSQIARLDALLKNQIPPDSRKNLHYIYLQYTDRAYYQ